MKAGNRSAHELHLYFPTPAFRSVLGSGHGVLLVERGGEGAGGESERERERGRVSGRSESVRHMHRHHVLQGGSRLEGVIIPHVVPEHGNKERNHPLLWGGNPATKYFSVFEVIAIIMPPWRAHPHSSLSLPATTSRRSRRHVLEELPESAGILRGQTHQTLRHGGGDLPMLQQGTCIYNSVAAGRPGTD